MRSALIAMLLLWPLLQTLPGAARPAAAERFTARVLDLDPAFATYFDMPVEVTVLADGLEWAEGPVWVDALDALLFSDVAADTIYRWDQANGLDVYLTPSGHEPDDAGHAWRGANGLAIDHRGRLLLAQQSGRRIVRLRASIQAPSPAFEVLAEAWRGARLNSPNDLVVSRRGDIYFTDPPYGLAGFEDSEEIELSFFGVFRLSSDGDLTPLLKGLAKPNGIALTHDQSRLLVSNSAEDGPRILSIDLDAEGAAGATRLFFDAKPLIGEGAGSTDGLTIHPDGAVFASMPGGVALLSAHGRLLGRLAIGQVTNAALDPCQCVLYLTTPDRLLRVPLKTTP